MLDLIDRAGWMAADSWRAHRVFLRASEGDRLAPDEPPETMALFTACTGRSTWPTRRPREVLGLMGRDGGKSVTMARKAVAVAATFDRAQHPTMADGEVPTVLVLAADREQAQVVYGYILAALLSDPALAAMIVGTPTAERIELRNGVVIVVGTSHYRWVRGRCYIFVVGDEASFWSREHKANPATAVLAAIRPGLRFADSQLCLISTPYAQRDAVWEIYQKHWGRDDAEVLVWKAPTVVMNPTLPAAVIDTARAADPVAARSEWDAEFRSDLESFVPTEVVEADTDRGVTEREPEPGALTVGAIDPAGSGGPLADSFAAGFGTPRLADDGRIESVLDCIIEFRPPYNIDEAVARIAAECRRRGVDVLTTDKYAPAWVARAFAAYGITCITSTLNKSEIYVEALGLLTSGRARLLDMPRLKSQLTSLERRSGRSGKDSIDHPPTVGSHDDVANVACSVLVLCQTLAADLAQAEAQSMSPAEAAALRAFQRTFGGPVEEPAGFVADDTGGAYQGRSMAWSRVGADGVRRALWDEPAAAEPDDGLGEFWDTRA